MHPAVAAGRAYLDGLRAVNSTLSDARWAIYPRARLFRLTDLDWGDNVSNVAEPLTEVPARILVRSWRTSDAISTRRPSPQAGWMADKEQSGALDHSVCCTL